MHSNLRKHFFSNRLVAVWNSRHNTDVSAESTNIFKNRLTKFWTNQDFEFDFRADINGIGNRSINNLSYV